jgi:hypothetical protein
MYGWTALTQDCREQFRRINLHWHDLRHEYASRLVERGVPLSQVRDLLGHASIVTTERYDNHQLERLQVAPGKLESGKLFHPPTLGSGTEFRISLTTVRRAGPWNPSPQSTTSVSCCKNNQLRIGWEAGIRARSRRAEGEPRRA